MEFFPLVVLGIGTACVGTLIVFILALILRSRFCASSSSASASDRRRLPVAPSSNSHSIVDKSTALLPSTPTSVTNNSTTLVSPYRNNPVSNNTINNKHHTETDPANPDIIPGANTYSTDTNNDWTLPRRNNHNSPACIPHEDHMDPLGGTIIATDYKSSHYIAYSPMHNQHEQFHPHNLPLFPASNNYQHANKNDYNTIYIRDKLMHDSDIPESCV